jgi:cytochrome P450
MLLPKFDSLDPAVISDPYSVYSALRSTGPICRGGPGQWVVTHYSEVSSCLRDHRLSHCFPEAFHRFSAGEGPSAAFFRNILLDRDPPQHTYLRNLLSNLFPGSLGAVAPRIQTLVDQLLVPALDGESFDIVGQLARQLPVNLICDLLGFAVSDRTLIAPHAINLARGFGIRVPEEDRILADSAVVWFREYVETAMQERRLQPGNDGLSKLLAQEKSHPEVTHQELVDNVVFLFFAGFETTMNLIGNGMAALLQFPCQMQRLRSDPELVPSAVEEFLRFDSPIQTAARLTLEPIEIGGTTIRPGRVAVLLVGSANRDERRFENPDCLDIGRKDNAHVAFGGGPHYCLGATLARLEAATVFRTLFDRFAAIERAGEPTRHLRPNFRSYRSVPIRGTAS